MKWSPLMVVALFAAAGSAAAAPIVDGDISGDGYGAALSVQAVQTQFGDNLSELNAAYATIDAGRLFLAFTGNIEDNFNKFEIFIDSQAGGENTLSGSPGNDNAGNMAGLTFDSGFAPDYHLIARRGFDGAIDRFDLDFAALGTPDFTQYFDIFGGLKEGAGATGTGLNAMPIGVGYDNSNVAGIGGGDGAADQGAALAVTTGLELSIDLADLGSPVGAFKVLIFVNNGDHNFASNQFLGPLAPPQGNLGGDGFGTFTGTLDFNLNDFAGDQFFVVPAPGAATLLGVGGLTLLRRRR